MDGGFKFRFASGWKDVDFESLLAVPGIEYEGMFYFCWDGDLHAAPILEDGTVGFDETQLVEDWESPEDYRKLKEIARKLKCRFPP